MKKHKLYAPPAPPVIPNAPDRMTQEITALSFNAWTNRDSLGERLHGVVQTIKNAMPDSFGLQEAHGLWREPIKQALCDDYAIACQQGRELSDIDEGVPVFYLKNKYELAEEGVFWLSETPEKASMGWDAACERMAGYAVLKDKTTGFMYVHFNTHLDHKGAIAMTNGARQVADKINAMGLPAVLTGDLNDTPGSRPMEYLAAGGLKDLRAAAAETDDGETFHGYGSKDGGKIIDYVMANHYLREAKSYRVVRDKYDGMYPSDHFAVMAIFTLAN